MCAAAACRRITAPGKPLALLPEVIRALKGGGGGGGWKAQGKDALASRSPSPFTLASSPVLRSFPAREYPSRIGRQEHPEEELLQPVSGAADILSVAAGLPQLLGGTVPRRAGPRRHGCAWACKESHRLC